MHLQERNGKNKMQISTKNCGRNLSWEKVVMWFFSVIFCYYSDQWKRLLKWKMQRFLKLVKHIWQFIEIGLVFFENQTFVVLQLAILAPVKLDSLHIGCVFVQKSLWNCYSLPKNSFNKKCQKEKLPFAFLSELFLRFFRFLDLPFILHLLQVFLVNNY